MLRQLVIVASHKTLTPILARTRFFTDTTENGKDGKPEVVNRADVAIFDYDDPDYLPFPEYPFRPNEPLNVKKQRLIYQSRKRGMLENDLILSTFVSKYLKDMDAKLTDEYDRLINGVSNDWDIYYWATGHKPTPPEYDNEIMRMLKQHVTNDQREQRLRQPKL